LGQPLSYGVEDAERARRMVKGAIGKRLTYRQPDNKKPEQPQGSEAT